jgi:hypothetical protein
MGYTHDCEKKRQHVQTLLAAAERGFQITKFQFWAARFEITGFRSQNDGWAKAKIDRGPESSIVDENIFTSSSLSNKVREEKLRLSKPYRTNGRRSR